jgi:hypothetical protein
MRIWPAVLRQEARTYSFVAAFSKLNKWYKTAWKVADSIEMAGQDVNKLME